MLIELSEQEVGNLMQILTNTTGSPWVITHPLIMKIGQQQAAAQEQAQRQAQGQTQPQAETMRKGNSHDRGDGDLDPERSAAAGARTGRATAN